MSLRVMLLVSMGPLLALTLFLFAQLVMALNADRKSHAFISVAAEESILLAAAVHELQKERGYSAGHVASKGANFVSELAEQRKATDMALAAFKAADDAEAVFDQKTLAQLWSGMAELADQRGAIDQLAIQVPSLAAYYTAMIDALLEASEQMKNRAGGDLITMMEATNLIARAKERAGLERAMGATILGAGTLPLPIYRRFLVLGEHQPELLERAAIALKKGNLMAILYDAPEGREAARLRSAIASAAFNKAEFAFGAAEWFKASTAWIDLLRGVETDVLNQLATEARAHAAKATQRMWMIGSFMLVAVVAMAGIAVAVAEWMTRRLRKLTEVMFEFVDGRFEAWVPYIDAKGELGMMAQSIYRFKQLSRAAIRQKDEDEAQLHAKHQAVVDLVTDGLNALANADLSRHFHEPLAPEYDAIRDDFNTATTRLRDVMTELAAVVGELEVRSRDMHGSAGDLASRTNTQVETIGDTANTVSGLTETLSETSESLRSAKMLAGEARGRADRSGTVVRNAVEAMDRIAQSSGRIAQITSVIEDISFQTNLLALNAGVEAARAGASGKGFAVVATEVQSLANRSAEAAKEIKELIEQSGKEVSGGVKLVGETGEALQEILDQILKVDNVLSDVSTAAEAQSRELRGVNDSIGQLRDLTSQNTAVADASLTSSNDLADRARRLAQIVGEFQLEGAESNETARAA